MSVRTQNAYDEWAPSYESDPNPHIVLEYQDVLGLVAPKQGQYILDAACGTGRYTSAFSKKGAEVLGMDFSQNMLRIARKLYKNIPFVKADVQDSLPLKSEVFHTVNCAQCLKHLPEISPVICEFYRVLRPHGRLVFSVTHPDMIWKGYEMRTSPEFILSNESDIYHHCLFDYRKALTKAGFATYQEVTVCVSESIKHLLTESSYQRVKGRSQILIFHARK